MYAIYKQEHTKRGWFKIHKTRWHQEKKIASTANLFSAIKSDNHGIFYLQFNSFNGLFALTSYFCKCVRVYVCVLRKCAREETEEKKRTVTALFPLIFHLDGNAVWNKLPFVLMFVCGKFPDSWLTNIFFCHIIWVIVCLELHAIGLFIQKCLPLRFVFKKKKI